MISPLADEAIVRISRTTEPNPLLAVVPLLVLSLSLFLRLVPFRAVPRRCFPLRPFLRRLAVLSD